MKLLRPPQALRLNGKPGVFLAGSIDQGEAEDWQHDILMCAAPMTTMDIVFLNPRRDDWDATWDQDDSHPEFVRQVNWELNAMDKAEMVVMYFAPGTKSPITLLELGLYATSGKLIVCCPNGFWRKGNVDIVCKRNKITQVKTLDELRWSIFNRYWHGENENRGE